MNLFVLFVICISGYAQKSSGTIYFYENDSVKFENLRTIYACPKANNRGFASSYVYFYLKSSLEMLHFSGIKEFEILSIEKINDFNYSLCTVKIKTRNGIAVINKEYTFQYLTVDVFNKSTGKSKPTVYFAARKNVPNIRKIVFN